ncbi:hypothetical protein G3I59_00515 [Amycolatopsis rubida]|uniref:Uncharacterized protein n=1 Tax=Amycolatopsis rubida TaxID=112413 RepID=A0A1I5YY43_9PSEU|nr:MULTISPECIES: hypothetical protein [Amycolatopsis]MYW89148.1 hypothetical protein [Amycolatopsis rubida]NEC54126.1 hypothetical protein [Amycolatopsis rubida]OAP23426.1 hypothetical protein A4R44_06075 [Amycolatopsis sp. M39]SFQ49151.1 hypothetical protein SAMN05421854_113116 [Amycolatopsis rubida]
MTAHARRFGRQCREHFERPETASAAEPERDAETVPAPAPEPEPEVRPGK